MVPTDNSFLADKVALRVQHLPPGAKLRVLDCYAGNGLVWKAVRHLTGRQIDVLPIDERDDIEGFYLQGDNRIYLRSLDLSRFDIIDLDAYGVPFDQVARLFEVGFQGGVFVTFIQTIVGILPHALLHEVGFSQAMIESVPALCAKQGWQHWRDYLAKKGVTTIWHRSHARKHYLYFDMPKTLATVPPGVGS